MTAYLSDGAQAMLREMLKARGVRRPSVIETRLDCSPLWEPLLGQYVLASFGYEGRTKVGKIALVSFVLTGWHHPAAPILVPANRTGRNDELTGESLAGLIQVQQALAECLVKLSERAVLPHSI